jgi:PadR family transcriptional regulator, regulatory protein PadR
MPYVFVMRRKKGELLPLELQILAVAAAARDEFHGFGIARELGSHDDSARLIGHGTLYKALDRLREQGFLTSRWEDPEVAEREGRPRRRLYRITDAGRVAITTANAVVLDGMRRPTPSRVTR